MPLAEGPPHPVTGKRQQVPRRADTKKEAEERCMKLITELVGGLDVRAIKNITFEDAAWVWYKDLTKNTQPRILKIRFPLGK